MGQISGVWSHPFLSIFSSSNFGVIFDHFYSSKLYQIFFLDVSRLLSNDHIFPRGSLWLFTSSYLCQYGRVTTTGNEKAYESFLRQHQYIWFSLSVSPCTHNDHFTLFSALLVDAALHRPRVQASWVLGPHWAGLVVAPPSWDSRLPRYPSYPPPPPPPTPPTPPPPHPAGTRTAGPAADGSYWFSYMPNFCHSRYSPHSTAWITPLKRSADDTAGDVARSERLRPACVFARPLFPSLVPSSATASN